MKDVTLLLPFVANPLLWQRMEQTTQTTTTATSGRAQRQLCIASDITTRKVITPEIDATAARVAYSRARFYFLGGAKKGKVITRGKNKGKLRDIEARDGCGMPLDWQAIEELKAAARAELLACEMEGIDPRESFRRARNAAQKLLHNSTREMIYADATTAQNAGERAATRAREIWDAEPLPANDVQPFWGEQTGQTSRATLAKALRATRDALRAYWMASASPYARQGLRLDFRLARELLAMSEAGTLEIKNGDALRKRCERMAKRVDAGRELLTPATATAARETQATLPLAVPVKTISLAITRGEVLAENVERNRYARELTARQRATMHDLARLADAFKVS